MNHASEGDLTIAMVMVIEFIMPLLICILSMRNSLSVIVGVSALIIFYLVSSFSFCCCLRCIFSPGELLKQKSVCIDPKSFHFMCGACTQSGRAWGRISQARPFSESPC